MTLVILIAVWTRFYPPASLRRWIRFKGQVLALPFFKDNLISYLAEPESWLGQIKQTPTISHWPFQRGSEGGTRKQKNSRWTCKWAAWKGLPLHLTVAECCDASIGEEEIFELLKRPAGLYLLSLFNLCSRYHMTLFRVTAARVIAGAIGRSLDYSRNACRNKWLLSTKCPISLSYSSNRFARRCMLNPLYVHSLRSAGTGLLGTLSL